jgi:peptidyl-prolyl cis-trans isomerase D
LPGIEQPRELIRWAYGAKVGEVSKAFNAGEKYVVAKLTEVKEKGVLPMEAVKEQVKAGAIKAKKAETLFDKATKMGSGATSIEDVAAKLQKTAQIATNVSFASNYNASLGNEQEILGKIFTAKAGTLSKPVKGNSGVFVFVVDAFNEPPALTDAKAARLQLEKAKAQRADYETGNAVKEKMEIVDNRGKYF